MKLLTERLILRPITINDGAFVFKLMNTEDWKKFIGDRNIHTIQDAIQYIEEKMISQYKEVGYGNFVICHRQSQEKLGTVGLYRRPNLEGVDIGFALLPEYYRNGYTYEASKKLLQYAQEELKLSPIQAITDVNNVASQSLIQKLGFTFIDKRKIESIDHPLLYFLLK